MTNFRSVTLGELALEMGLPVVGDAERRVIAIVSPDEATRDTLCAVWDERVIACIGDDIPIVAPRKLFEKTGKDGKTRDGIAAESPRDLLPELLSFFAPRIEKNKGIHASAVLSPYALVSSEAWIGPCVVVEAGAVIEAGAQVCAGSYVGPDCKIGSDTVIEPGVVLLRGVRVGKKCLLHSGCVLGCDGFGFIASQEGPVKIPQIGGVVVGDGVEIGACTTIDRGTLSDTFIGSGTKIDNHVQIGHNVKVGNGCIICSMSGIAGSSVLEDGVTLSVQAGVTDHVRIGAGAVLAARSGVTKDVPAGAVMSGFPVRPHSDARKALALSAELPELFKRVRRMEKQVENIRAEMDKGAGKGTDGGSKS